MHDIHSVLSSSRPNDAISEQLLDSIGYDDIELVMEILDQRASFAEEVRRANGYLIREKLSHDDLSWATML